MKKIVILIIFLMLFITMFSGIIYNFNNSAFVKENKYFKFIFEKGLNDYVAELEDVSDKLYEDYSTFYETNPGSITVYIFDDVDFVNSFAVPPLNTIRLYINPPIAKMGLSLNVENWISFVFSHELNHIFYGNTLNQYVSWIPNNTVRKALMMNWTPSYLHEGLSIYMESKYFNGRFQNDLFNMYIKAEILSNNYPGYALGSGSYKSIWSPAGFNYMYGAIITREIAEKYGENVLKQIIKEINSHLFLSTISGAFEKITDEKWADFLLYIKVKYKNEYLELLNKGYTDNYVKINASYHFTSNLKTDGKYIYYYNESPGKRKGVYRNDTLVLPDISKFDVSENGEILYLVSNKNEKDIKSLYLKCDCPISNTLIDTRVTNFAFAGNYKVVYTKINKGLTAVFLKNLNTGKIEKLLDYGKYTINDFYYFEDKIYFSGIINNQNDLFYINLKNRDLIQLTDDKYIELNIFIKDNKLYYSANYEDNIYNVYSLDLKTQKLSKLTNHIYGAFYPIVLENKLYFLYYDSTGYHFSNIDIHEQKLNKTFFEDRAINIDYIPEKITKTAELEKYIEPLKYNFVLPYAEEDKIGGIYLSLSEGLNYAIGGGMLTNFNEIIPLFGFYLDRYTQNLAIFKYENNKLYSNINISKSFEFHLKKQNYLAVSSIFEMENLKINSKTMQIKLLTEPYRINKQDYYESQSIFGFKDNVYYFQYSKAFDIYSIKSEPYIYYDIKGNLIPGLKISKRLWYPYFSILDGKYGFDGVNGSIDYSYNLKEKKSKFEFSLNLDFTAFYWVNFPLPITIK